MTLGELLKSQRQQLERAGVPGAESDLQWIAGSVTRFNRVQLMINREFVLPPEQAEQIKAMVERRCRREPLQYILGNQSFMNLKLRTDSRALIPRPETELLAEHCIRLIKKDYPRFAPFRLLDIGTGTGALALGIAKAASNVRAVGVDISPDALELAKENCGLCGLEERVTFLQSDLFSAVEGQVFDGIVSNPPYIPTRVVPELMPEVSRFEPHIALDGGEYGMDFYQRIIPQAAYFLKSGGFIALEAEHFQFDAIKELFAQTGAFTPAACMADYEGRNRLCSAKKL